jgi:hypothetical protein
MIYANETRLLGISLYAIFLSFKVFLLVYINCTKDSHFDSPYLLAFLCNKFKFMHHLNFVSIFEQIVMLLSIDYTYLAIKLL